jgi:hypothetical protein
VLSANIIDDDVDDDFCSSFEVEADAQYRCVKNMLTYDTKEEVCMVIRTRLALICLLSMWLLN